MKKVNIFIASSAEMKLERLEIIDLLEDLSLNDIWYHPVIWESMPSEMRAERKEDEYLRRLHQCEVCITLFWKTLGKYTKEELLYALNGQKNSCLPKRNYILIKATDMSSPELKSFIEEIRKEYTEIINYFTSNNELRILVERLLRETDVDGYWERLDVPNIKEIPIMIAADEELHEEKLLFTELIHNLNEVLEHRGLRLRRIKWTPGESNEYLQMLNKCEMCLNLYWKQLPTTSDQELKTAYEATCTGNNPRHLYIFFKEPSKDISVALADFKESFETRYGHFFCRFENVDTMNLHFVLQFEAWQNTLVNDLVKADKGDVKFGDKTIAKMSNLRFVSGNPDYRRMSNRLLELSQEIVDVRILIKDYPDIERYQEKLQKLLDERNSLQEEFEKQQFLLLDTAKRIANLQNEAITNRMSQAIDAFERGDVREANIILDGVEKDGDDRFAYFERKEVLRNKEIKNIHWDIEGLLIQAAAVMPNVSVPIKDRINKAIQLYKKADYRAFRTDYDKKKYTSLLFAYADFLYKYGFYRDLEGVLFRSLQYALVVYGAEHPIVAKAYNSIGVMYLSRGVFSKALECFKKALEIDEQYLGPEHMVTVAIINNIGVAYKDQGNYIESLNYFQKALATMEKENGIMHPYTATLYNNIGTVYWKRGDLSEAMKNHQKALEIDEKVLGLDHGDTARCYENVGTVFHEQGDYSKAIEYYKQALAIKKEILGPEHPDTASLYYNFGLVYRAWGDTPQALLYFKKSLIIREKTLIFGHPNTISSYNGIISACYKLGDINQALEYIKKVLVIREQTLGVGHPETADSYQDIALVYEELGYYDLALKYHIKSLEIREKAYGIYNAVTANSYNSIGITYQKKGDNNKDDALKYYKKALKYYKKALAIRERILGMECQDTADVYNNIGSVHYKMGEYSLSLEYYKKSLLIDEKLYGTDNPITLEDYHNIAALYSHLRMWEEHLEYLQKAKEI